MNRKSAVYSKKGAFSSSSCRRLVEIEAIIDCESSTLILTLSALLLFLTLGHIDWEIPGPILYGFANFCDANV